MGMAMVLLIGMSLSEIRTNEVEAPANSTMALDDTVFTAIRSIAKSSSMSPNRNDSMPCSGLDCTLGETDVMRSVYDAFSYNGPLPVPSFDSFVGLHRVINAGVDSEAKDQLKKADYFATSGRFGTLLSLGKIVFVPAKDSAIDSVKALAR